LIGDAQPANPSRARKEAGSGRQNQRARTLPAKAGLNIVNLQSGRHVQVRLPVPRFLARM
jgi:hypothetical protein